jgi:hypothetical protein
MSVWVILFVRSKPNAEMVNFVEDLVNIIPEPFGSKRLNSFRGEEKSLQATDGQIPNYD